MAKKLKQPTVITTREPTIITREPQPQCAEADQASAGKPISGEEDGDTKDRPRMALVSVFEDRKLCPKCGQNSDRRCYHKEIIASIGETQRYVICLHCGCQYVVRQRLTVQDTAKAIERKYRL